MIKIAKLKKAEYMKIYKDMELSTDLKQRLGLPEENSYCIGDTLVYIGCETQEREVYADTSDGREFRYIVAKPINPNVSFCYSVYQVNNTN